MRRYFSDMTVASLRPTGFPRLLVLPKDAIRNIANETCLLLSRAAKFLANREEL